MCYGIEPQIINTLQTSKPFKNHPQQVTLVNFQVQAFEPKVHSPSTVPIRALGAHKAIGIHGHIEVIPAVAAVGVQALTRVPCIDVAAQVVWLQLALPVHAAAAHVHSSCSSCPTLRHDLALQEAAAEGGEVSTWAVTSLAVLGAPRSFTQQA